MEKCWFHLMLSNKKLEHRYVLNKSNDSIDVDALGHTSGSEEPFLKDAEKNIPSWGSYSLSNIHYLNSFFDCRNIWSLISDYTFLVINSKGDSYSIYFDIENQIFDMDNASSFLSELDIFFSFLKNKIIRVAIYTTIILWMKLNIIRIIPFIVSLKLIFILKLKSVLIMTFTAVSKITLLISFVRKV
ncbi:hypothetical protein KSP40_PGU002208 [Platanthera guangdongensis]|uniref:Acetyl-CoA carboxylase beta subunit n=1 Tax=Platanthera guangdongensis TaxID=2320717 RepID=A0ABR2LEI4_9ASPA